jgi:hypothetical protein
MPEPDPGALVWDSLEDEKDSGDSKADPTDKDETTASSQGENDDPESYDFLFGADSDLDSNAEAKSESANKSDSDKSVFNNHPNQPESGNEPESLEKPDWFFPDTPDETSAQQPGRHQGNHGGLNQPAFNQPPMHQPSMNQPFLAEPFGGDAGYQLSVETGHDWWSQPALDPLWSDRFTKMTSLDAVVFSAMQNAPTVTLVNTEPQIAQTMVTEADARFDWSTFVDASWNDVDQAVVSLLDTGTAGGRFLQQQLQIQGGLKKQTRTGGHLRVGQALQRTDNNSDFLSPPDQATTQLLLDYRQPLLKGAGRQVNQSQIMLAQIGLEASQDDSQVQLQQFLVDVVSKYWRLYQARGNLLQKLRSANRAEQLLQKLSERGNSAETQRLIYRVQDSGAKRRCSGTGITADVDSRKRNGRSGFHRDRSDRGAGDACRAAKHSTGNGNGDAESRRDSCCTRRH